MPKLGDLFVQVSARGAPQANTQIATVDKTAAKAGNTFNKLATAIGGMIAAFAAYRGIQLFSRWLQNTVTNAIDAEVQFVKLEAVLNATNHAAGLGTAELQKMAREMMLLTGITDEEVIATEALLLTFTQIGKEVFPDALSAAADMSVMFGQDLRQSAIQLGTALNDPIRGVGRLRRIGISFTIEQRESIKAFVEQNDIMAAQRVILDELQVEFGGVAQAIGTTFQGKLNIIKSLFGEIEEAIGNTVVQGASWRGMLDKIIGKLLELEQWLIDNKDAIESISEAVATLAENLGTIAESTIMEEVIPAITDFSQIINALIGDTTNLGKAFNFFTTGEGKIFNTLTYIKPTFYLNLFADALRGVGLIGEKVGDEVGQLEEVLITGKRATDEGTESTKKNTKAQREAFEAAQEWQEMEQARIELIDINLAALNAQTEEVEINWEAWARYYEGVREQEALVRAERLKTAALITARIQPVFQGFFNALTVGGDAWQQFGDRVIGTVKRIIVQLMALAAVGLTLKALGLGGLIDIAAAASRIFGGGTFQDPTMDLRMQREGRDVARLFSLGFKEGMQGAFGGLQMRPQPIALKIFADPSVMVENMTGLPFNQKDKFYKEMTLEVEDRR